MPKNNALRKLGLSSIAAALSFAGGVASLVAPAPVYAAVGFDAAQEVESPSNRLAITARTAPPDAQGRYMTIVRFNEAPIASYTGGVQGLAATSPRVRGENKLDASASHVKAYENFLAQRQSEYLTQISSSLQRSAQPRFQYLHVLNAVALPLTLDEAGKLANMDFVRSIQLEELDELDTDVGPGFIGAPALWNGISTSGLENKGEGIIVGIIDSGFVHAHPSFAAIAPGDGYVHTNPLGSFRGLCVATPSLCNDKLIGSYNFHPDTSVSEDTSGHGTHVASTAAGNPVTATYAGLNVPISGVAPRANLINYRVCFPTCPTSSSVNAVNQGVIDGVDALNFSISGSDGPWNSSVDLAFLDAFNAGIFVSASAGNSGPGASTVAHTGPWNATVANSLHNRIFGFSLDLTQPGAPVNTQDVTIAPGGAPISNVTLTDQPLITSPGFANGATDGCAAFPANTFRRPAAPGGASAIAVIHLDGATSACASGTRRTNALNAGASGVIFVDVLYLNLGASGTSWSMRMQDWLNIATHVATDPNAATITITAPLAPRDSGLGDVVASGSSRGPSQFNMIMPDIAAPGTAILAAYLASTGDFNAISGTSMAAPHSTGAAALMIKENPTWTPAQIKSAMALTAAADMTKEDSITPSDPFDRGSGRIDLNKAAVVSLAMDETYANFVAANPDIGGDPRTLNLPSFKDNACIETCSFTRTVTSVIADSVDYDAQALAPAGVVVTVTPSAFTLAAGASQVLVIDVTTDTDVAPPGVWAFGEVRLVPSAGPGATTTLIDESFADVTFPPTGWAQFKLSGTGTTAWVRHEASFNTSPASARRFYGGAAEGNQIEFLVTPPMQLGDNSTLTFSDRVQFPTFYGKHSVLVSTASCIPADGDFVEVVETGVNADAALYFPRNVSLAAFDNEEVCVAFRYEGNDAATWFVDDVQVTSTESSVLPTLRMPMAILPQLGAALIDVTPLAMSATLDQGLNTASETVSIGNLGGEDLLWSVSADASARGLLRARGSTPINSVAPASTFGISGLRTSKTEGTGSVRGTLEGITLSHSVSNNIAAASGVACGTGPNSFLRVYTPGDFGIAGEYDITRVAFGIETLATASPITVNLYSYDPINPLTLANLTLVASETANFGVSSLSSESMPISYTVPAGGTVVVEVKIAGTMFPGANSAGQTSPSYIVGPACGVAEITSYAAIGFPNAHLVINLASDIDVDCGANGYATWASLAPDAGIVSSGATQNATFTFNAEGLDAGNYSTNLCLESNDPANPLTIIPVSLDVDAAAVIGLSDSEFVVSALPGDVVLRDLGITNLGGLDLDWTVDTAAQNTLLGGIPASTLWSNGPLVNSPGTGPGGTDQSILQNTSLGMTSLGSGIQSPTRLADNFTVDDPAGWQVANLRFYAYQTNAVASPFTGVNYRIWDGPPNDPASAVVFGDTTTNRFAATGNTNIFRVSQTTVNTARIVWFVDASGGFVLPPGEYWVDWSLTATPAGAFAPPITINGQSVTGNALQFFSGAWNPLVDGGNQAAQGMPFEVTGTTNSQCVLDPGPISWLSVSPAAGTATPGATDTVTATIDTTGLAPDVYEAQICVASNDASQPLIAVPVSVTVGVPATIDVDSSPINAALAPGGVESRDLIIGNTGQIDLNWSIDEAAVAAQAYVYGRPGAGTASLPQGFDRASGTSPQGSVTHSVAPAPQGGAISTLTEGFETVAALPGAGWALQNNSAPVGTSGWFQGTATLTAQAGAATSYIGANFNNTTGTNTISNWLMTPEVQLQNGTELRFWTNRVASSFEDRLQVRLSTAGTSTNVGASATSVGDFTELLLDINPTYAANGYPRVWTEFVVTVSGLPAATTGRLAFRYFVELGGPDGDNSDFIGIDTVSITQPMAPPTGCDAPTDLSWLTVSPAAGTTVGGDQSVVSVQFDATGLPDGTVNGELCINSNDASNPRVTVPVSLTVTTVDVEVSPATLAAGTFGAAYAATLTASGDNTTAPFSFAVTDGALPGGLTLSGAGELSGTATAAGSFNFTVTATDSSLAGSGGPFSGSAAYTLVIAQAAQNIDFAALSDRVLTDSPFTVSATASSGLAVSFASTGSVCSVAGDQVSLLTTGTCTITASQTGNANFQAAADVQQSFEVEQIEQSITFGALADRVLGDAPFTVSATATSGLDVTFASSTGKVCSVTGDEVTLLAPGFCTIVASQAGDATYEAADDVSRSFEVIDPTITIEPGTLSRALIDDVYIVQFTASGDGATGPFTFAVTDGALPDGMTLDAEGELSGIPTEDGEFVFTVTATDSTPGTNGGPFTGSRVLTLEVVDTFIFMDGFEAIVE